MFAPNNQRTDCIDRDHYEASPSTGWRETCVILHASGGAEYSGEVSL